MRLEAHVARASASTPVLSMSTTVTPRSASIRATTSPTCPTARNTREDGDFPRRAVVLGRVVPTYEDGWQAKNGEPNVVERALRLYGDTEYNRRIEPVVPRFAH